MSKVKDVWQNTARLRNNIKRIRIGLLTFLFSFFSANAYFDMNPTWSDQVTIVIHPTNVQKNADVDAFIKTLKQSDIDEVSEFISKNATYYRGSNTKVRYVLGSTMDEPPQDATEEDALSILAVAGWSLKFRWYAISNMKKEDIGADAVIYLNFAPDDHSTLNRSTALQRGRIALVNIHAGKDNIRMGNMVLAHESLHLFGAVDQYDMGFGSPIYPNGYAEPNKIPLYPQTKAEIMGGYIPINEADFLVPNSLDEVVILAQTAKDIGWLK